MGDEAVTKKARLSDNGTLAVPSIHDNLHSLEKFRLTRVLKINASLKTLTVEASVEGSSDPAVVVLEKLPFSAESGDQLLTADTALSQLLHNDIYGNYTGLPAEQLNSVKLTIIHPATQKHIDKYSSCRQLIVDETPQLYKQAVQPFISQQQFSIEWVYNILEHRSEVDRIVFEDPDSDTGFVLLPDLKWDGVTLESLYLTAIVRRRDVTSIRHLNQTHLPLLRNIRDSAVKAVTDKYGLHCSELRVYFHYLPSYYHLHVHINAVTFDAPGCHVTKAHLLSTVIGNIELLSDFYQKATLSYSLPATHGLVGFYRDAGYCLPDPDPVAPIDGSSDPPAT